ncbi:MAG: hypothetical protein HUU16_21895 [Candidatus Omnitrophica bacterium]|nr:hypothetical protein [Candidatus Omnitrophota bacterium]
MTLPEEMARDAAGVFEEFGETVEWGGRSLRALVSDPEIGVDLEVGGFGATGDFTVKLLRSDLAAGLPKVGEAIAFEGRRYRITRVSERPTRPLVVLTVSAQDA